MPVVDARGQDAGTDEAHHQRAVRCMPQVSDTVWLTLKYTMCTTHPEVQTEVHNMKFTI